MNDLSSRSIDEIVYLARRNVNDMIVSRQYEILDCRLLNHHTSLKERERKEERGRERKPLGRISTLSTAREKKKGASYLTFSACASVYKHEYQQRFRP